MAARAVLEKRTVHIPDVLADSEYTFLEAQKRAAIFGTALGVPLLRGRRRDRRDGTDKTLEVQWPFDEGHITLVTTFADQAMS